MATSVYPLLRIEIRDNSGSGECLIFRDIEPVEEEKKRAGKSAFKFYVPLTNTNPEQVLQMLRELVAHCLAEQAKELAERAQAVVAVSGKEAKKKQ